MKLTALLLPVLVSVSAVPETYQSFKADLESTVSQKTSSLSTSIVMTGKLSVSNPLKRVRTDVNKIEVKIDMGDMGDMGGGLPDLSGGLPSSGRRLLAAGVSGVELLRYDMGKNFTWMTEAGKTTCDCSPLLGDMPQFFVDATAVSAGEEDLTINDVKVPNAEKWTSTLSLGLAGMDGGTTFAYTVEVNPDKATSALRQVLISSSVGAADLAIKQSITMKFWNVEQSDDVAWSQPHPSCVCPSTAPPVIPVAKAYPAPEAACTADAGCACVVASTTEEPTIEFCKDIVTWPIAEVLFPKSTDNFVKTAYDMPGLSDTCLVDYKVFLCKFYFQICSEGGKVLAPPAFTACTVASTETSGYTAVDNYAKGLNAAGEEGGDKIASGSFTVAASPLVLAGLAVAALLL